MLIISTVCFCISNIVLTYLKTIIAVMAGKGEKQVQSETHSYGIAANEETSKLDGTRVVS